MNQEKFDKYENLINQLLDCPDLKATPDILNQLAYLNNLKTTEEILQEDCLLIDDCLISAMEAKAENLIEEGKEEAAGWLRNLAEQLREKINSWDILNQKLQEVYSQNKLPEAIEVARQSLDLAKAIWQSDHPNVAADLHHLGWLLMFQQNYTEAEPFSSEALAMRQRLFSDEHPDVATSMLTLAQILKKQGKYDEAESFVRNALTISQKLHESDHPSIATSFGDLAQILMNQGKYDEAKSYADDALAMYQRLFSGDHREVATNLTTLAQLLTHRGQYSEAEILARDALAMYQRLFPGDHSEVAISLNSLAFLLMHQGKYKDAEFLFRKALAMEYRLFLGNHPGIATSLHNLAWSLMYQSNYVEAESLERQALAMNKWLFSGDHPSIAISSGNLAQLLTKQGNYGEAESLYRESLIVLQKLFPGGHPHLATDLTGLAQLLTYQGKYSEAEPFARQALEMYKMLFPENHPHVATSLSTLSQLLINQGNYTEAESLERQALAMRKRLFEGDHPDLAAGLYNLAELLNKQSRYNESEDIARDALAMYRKLFKDNHIGIFNSLHTLTWSLIYQGKYLEAEPLSRDVLAMSRQLFNGDHLNIATCLLTIAQLLTNQGRYREAESSSREAIAMYQRLYAENHPHFANSLQNLAWILMNQARYKEAESLYRHALMIYQRYFKGDHPQMAVSQGLLAQSLEKQGKYAEAEFIIKNTLAMQYRLFTEDHSDIATNLGVLADLLMNQGKYDEAETINRQVLAICQRLFSGYHPYIATSLDALGNSLAKQRKYKEAEGLYREALQMRYKLFAGNHPYIANNLNGLAWLLMYQGEYNEAESLAIEALAMKQRLLDNDHPSIADSLRTVAWVLTKQEKYNEALDRYQEAITIENRIINRIFALSSEAERLYHLNQVRFTTEFFLCIVFKYLPNDVKAICTAFDITLQRKSLGAATTAAFNAAIYEERYIHLREQLRKLQSVSEQIRNLETKTQPSKETKESWGQLKQDFERLQKYLVSEIPEIQLLKQDLDRQTIAERLPKDSVLIEFVRFYDYDFQNFQRSSPYYLAFVLPAKQPDKATIKVLGEAIEIEKLIETTRRQAILSTANGKLDMSWGQTPDNYEHSYRSPAAIQLHQAIVEPLSEYFEDSQQLFIVPDGKLSLIPFQLLPLDEQGEELLIDRYRISYLSAARDLFRSDIETQRPASPALVIADPKFDLDLATVSPASTNSGATLNISLLREEFEKQTESVKLNRAKATGILGKKVASLLNVQPHLQEDAVVTHLKNNQCPSIFFIGTHGLYLEQKREKLTEPGEPISLNPMNPYLTISQTENPMLRSALTFAGAETWLKGKNLPPEVGTGLLFAQEVAELDLWANEITVLLACNSAVGDVSIGEGVFGLRRAFAVAGAKTLIMSLWSVPENASALLMERFFNNLQQSGMERDKALQEAQNYIRNLTIPELLQSELGLEVMKELTGDSSLTVENASRFDEIQKPLSHPFYWAAWICQGKTAPLSSFSTASLKQEIVSLPPKKPNISSKSFNFSIESLKKEIAALSLERQSTLKNYPILTNPESLSTNRGWISQLKPFLLERNVAFIFYGCEPNQKLIFFYQELVRKIPNLCVSWITSSDSPLPFKVFSPQQSDLLNAIQNWLDELD